MKDADKRLDTMQAVIEHVDGVYNQYTGVGTTLDTTSFNSWKECRRDPSQYDKIYVESDIAKAIVDVPVDEALRSQPRITHESEEGSPIEWLESLNAFQKIEDAWKTARRVGSAALWIEAVGDASTPLEPGAEIVDIKVVDAGQLDVATRYNDPMSKNHRLPETYALGRKKGLDGTILQDGLIIHETRIIKLIGEPVPLNVAHKVDYWGLSILHRVFELVTSYNAIWQATMEATQRGHQPVLQLGDLMGALSSGKSELIIKRIDLLNRLRSSMRLIALDQSESFQYVQSPVASMTPVLEQAMFRISAAAQIPVTKLFGMSPGGMNATGESDLENFYNRVEKMRRRELTPVLRRLLDARGIFGEYTIDYEPLWQLSDQEMANARKTQADADAVYIDRGVVSPTEVALSRFTDDGYSFEMGTFDRDTREQNFENPVGFPGSDEGDL